MIGRTCRSRHQMAGSVWVPRMDSECETGPSLGITRVDATTWMEFMSQAAYEGAKIRN